MPPELPPRSGGARACDGGGEGSVRSHQEGQEGQEQGCGQVWRKQVPVANHAKSGHEGRRNNTVGVVLDQLPTLLLDAVTTCLLVGVIMGVVILMGVVMHI